MERAETARNERLTTRGQLASKRFNGEGVPLEYAVVLAELLIAVSMSYVAWRYRRTFSNFVSGILLSMTWCAFLHGFCFGVLQVEGRHAQSDPVGLIGFGIVTAILPGVPLGAIVGTVLVVLRARLRSVSNLARFGKEEEASRES